ncbi:glycosyltransferase family 2 protein [Arthrobacter mobilis]|uniref:Glycosyltransferase n=1 Tax=Arthrobacter mobilis TaxID=2724944 RepID=A0A7X6K4I1_9MICC|nr:glycosyltransferase [Arthrobacter mobilis]NKX55357.1 glycosyltransferase [Arthrobacter mobilis]
MTTQMDVSVVIGFKDWGINRLRMAVQTIQRSFGSLAGEVIVSDYGSAEHAETKRAMEEAGAVYVYTETDGVWSRSRALNAGFAVSSGRVLVSTDADMIFSPKSMEIVGKAILANPDLALVLQCRDLPEGYSDVELAGRTIDWRLLERVSRMRPRWGMGGMMAASRARYLEIRGLDERMEIYGGEDIDFANRLRRAGARLEWVVDDDVRMYHMWHAPSRKIASETAQGRKAIELNSKIHVEDKSVIRNTVNWQHRPADAELPVSVVVSTYNRASYIADSIRSVLAQSMPDFELIIVDDGSTDATREVVESFRDERIRYFYRENAGIAAARNFAASVSRGRYTAVHDDDDIMLPWRLEKHLAALRPGHHGSYGAWVDFDDETGEMNLLPGKDLSLGSLLTSGRVYLHPTMMIATEVVRRLGYDESLRSGSDYNLGIRMMRSGIRLNHTGYVHTLRRLHSGQITETDSVVQHTSAVLTQTMARVPMSTVEFRALHKAHSKTPPKALGERQEVLASVADYLPGHLVRRAAVVRCETAETVSLPDELMLADRHILEHDWDGQLISQIGVFEEVGLDRVSALQDAGMAVEVDDPSAATSRDKVTLMAIDAMVTAGRRSWGAVDEPVLVFASSKNLDWVKHVVDKSFPGAEVHQRLLSDEDALMFVLCVGGLPLESLENLSISASTRDLTLRSWIDFSGDTDDLAALLSSTPEKEVVK